MPDETLDSVKERETDRQTERAQDLYPKKITIY